MGSPFLLRDHLQSSVASGGVLSRNCPNRLLKQCPQSNSGGSRLPLALHCKPLNQPTAPLWYGKAKADFHGPHEKDLEVCDDHKLNVTQQGGVLHKEAVSSWFSEQWPDAKK